MCPPLKCVHVAGVTVLPNEHAAENEAARAIARRRQEEGDEAFQIDAEFTDPSKLMFTIPPHHHMI